MKLQVLSRKRIWEVDCLSLDACLAASYDWRELANLLKSSGVEANIKEDDALIEMKIHNLVHAYCHSENPVSLRIEMLLNILYNDAMCDTDALDNKESAEIFLQNLDLRKKRKLAAILWALGSDPREEMMGPRRFLHQRFQVLAMRGKV